MALRIFIFWGITCLFACTSKSIQDESLSVIYLKPDEAQVLKMSGLFDRYEVLTFKDITCNTIEDFIKIDNKIVASSLVREGTTPISTLCVFDSIGEFQYTLGKFGRGPKEYLYLPDKILLSQDSNIMAMDVLGLHCYALDGTLLWHKKFDRSSWEWMGYPEGMLNDSCIVYHDVPDCGVNYSSKRCFINLLSWKEERLKASWFPGQNIGKNVVKNHLYMVEDTLCYYSDIDNGVYHISEDTVILRYHIDKGGFKGFCPCRDPNRLSDYLTLYKMAENNKYVLILGTVKQAYYFFVYDKKKKVTSTFDSVDDDLLLLGHLIYKPESVLRLYNAWKPGMRQSDDYMYFYLSPTQFSMAMERLKETMSEEQWHQYRQTHPDIMKIYDELGDDSNTVVIGYHFK